MADTLDLVTLAAVKDTLEIATADIDHDVELAVVITAVSRRIDTLCGPVVIREVAGETHNGGRPYVRLRTDHASTVDSAVEYVSTTPTTLTAETNVSKPADGYLLDDIGGGVTLLRRRRSGSDATFAEGRRNVVVTYQAGRAANTASVDELFARAAIYTIQHLWKQSAPSWFTDRDFLEGPAPAASTVPRFAIPNVTMQLLADEIRIPQVA